MFLNPEYWSVRINLGNFLSLVVFVIDADGYFEYLSIATKIYNFFSLLSNNGPAKSICNSSFVAANSSSGLDELNGFDILML